MDGDVGEEGDFFADAAVDEADGVGFFDFGAVADAEAAVDAEGGVLVEAGAVSAVLGGE